MINKLLNIFKLNKDGENNGKLPKKYGYILVIGLAGVLLLLLSNLFTSSDPDPELNQDLSLKNDHDVQQASSEESSLTSDVNELEQTYKKDLELMLSKIQGVENVEVMINLDSTNVKVYEKNLITGKQLTDEKDKNGGNREIEDHTEETEVVLVRQGDQEVPLLIQTKKPSVRGVLVVATGVDHATVKQWVIESTSRVLNVPTHKVSVMPKN